MSAYPKTENILVRNEETHTSRGNRVKFKLKSADLARHKNSHGPQASSTAREAPISPTRRSLGPATFKSNLGRRIGARSTVSPQCSAGKSTGRIVIVVGSRLTG